MICQNCKTEVPDEASFCPNCGFKFERQKQPNGNLPIATNNVVRTLLDSTKGVGNSTFNTIEGILSVVLAVMIVCAPVIEVNYYFGSDTISMLTLVTNLARFSDYLGKYAIIAPLLTIDMIISCVGMAMNAFQAFKGELTQLLEITKDIKLPNASPGAATGYALTLIILLAIASDNTYGIAGASGMVWLLLLGGIVCQVIHFIRWSRIAPRT